MRVLVLGAGQDVGRSCVVVRIGGKTLMFDCGMHMGYQDARRFPDFSLLSPSNDYTSVIDALFISHFHMDHVGALPYFTEVCGYSGPVFMTYPTRAIAPLMLHDFYRVLLARPGTGPLFAARHIDAAMSKVRLLDLQETVTVCDGVEVTAYYAGHVLGAAMLHVRVGSESLVYTGDFNTVPERHLSGASIPRLCPDLLISESTYATSIREDRRSRERHLLKMVHDTVTSGGKVLVPVFAVGRAQELLMLLDEHWQRTQLEVPIYVSSIMAARANSYFKLLQNWASERVKQAAPGARASAFDFSRVQDWQPEMVDAPGACVLFATPGMLHGGTSLEVFKAWAPDPKNLVLLPSYQVAGTVGRKLLMGVRQGLQIDSKTKLDVRCKVDYAALSAHTDAKGILQIVQQVAPSSVLLVHGEADKMAFMCDKIQRSLNIPCCMPANGEEVQVASGSRAHAVPVSAQLLRRLPATVQQLQQQERWQQQGGSNGVAADGSAGGGAGSEGGVSLGQAAAGWLQEGNVGELAAAAMRLAGGASAAGVGAASDQPGQIQQQQQESEQQRLLQMHGTPAAARAAQLAPWLELLAAAAQDAAPPNNQQQPLQSVATQAQVGASASAAASVHEAANKATEGQRHPQVHLQASSLVSIASELQQQLQLQQQAVVLDGVLLVHHNQQPQQQPQQGANCEHQQPAVSRMQLLPAEAAAAALQMQQHAIKLVCKLRVQQGQQLQQQQHEVGQAGGVSAPGQQPVTAADDAVAAGYIAAVLRSGLPPPAASEVRLVHGEVAGVGGERRVQSAVVRVRSVTIERAAEAQPPSDDSSCWKCSWHLADDALAQQCVALVQQSRL